MSERGREGKLIYNEPEKKETAAVIKKKMEERGWWPFVPLVVHRYIYTVYTHSILDMLYLSIPSLQCPLLSKPINTLFLPTDETVLYSTYHTIKLVSAYITLIYIT